MVINEMNVTQPKVDLPLDTIAAFCRIWSITECALFGSVLRDDFRPESDIDVLVRSAT
jgi:predicted nucleotidyltransferase